MIATLSKLKQIQILLQVSSLYFGAQIRLFSRNLSRTRNIFFRLVGTINLYSAQKLCSEANKTLYQIFFASKVFTFQICVKIELTFCHFIVLVYT